MADPGQLPRQQEGRLAFDSESMRLSMWEFPALLSVWFEADPVRMSPEVAAMLETALENFLLWYHSETSDRSMIALTGLSNAHPRVRRREFLGSAVCYALMIRRLNVEYTLQFRVGESAPMLMRIHGTLRLVTRRGHVFECAMVTRAEHEQDESGRLACLWMVQDQGSVSEDVNLLEHVNLLWQGVRLPSFEVHVQERDQTSTSDDADTDVFDDANSDLFSDADTDPF